MSFQAFLERELNSEQKQAVLHKQGAVMVIAGAGSGKTRVITARIAHLLLHEHVQASSIVALTFTNKAAKEMKHRLVSFLGHNVTLPFIGTFHSYCLLLLRLNQELHPLRNFTILDAEDQSALIKKIIKKNNLEKQLNATQVGHHISIAKNKLLFDGHEETFAQPLFKEVFMAYESEKAAAHCLDFDDLLIQVLTAFKTQPLFVERFQNKVRHLLVDEYQDTSAVQHELLKKMALKMPSSGPAQHPLSAKNGAPALAIDSICAVGDEDQSIYSWRGAMVTNMLTFQKDFSPVTLIKIEQNYRSVEPILKAANAVIAHNTVRHPKELWSEKHATQRLLVVSCQNGYQEADAITTYLKLLPASQKRSSIAILYRTHFQSRSIEEALIQQRIPYHIVGGIRFYERKEIKDLLAYLRLIANPFDRPSFFRIINTPTRGLGTQFEELVYEEWNLNPLLDFKLLIHHLSNQSHIKGVKLQTALDFVALFDDLQPTEKTSMLVEKILKKTGYLSFLQSTLDPKESETKRENIREFLASISFFEQNQEQSEPTLENFLHEIALLQEKIDAGASSEDHVQLMTLHAVKGLEFDTVIIAGAEEGLLPSTRSLYSNDALEEERRLFYVGMTRAKERLLITHAHQRNSYGQVNDHARSRFVAEIPKNLYLHIEGELLPSYKLEEMLAQWGGYSKPRSPLVTFNTKAAANTKATTHKPSPSPFFSSNTVQAKAHTHRELKEVPRKPTLSSAPQDTSSVWRNNQPVSHATFGIGVIKKIEKKDASDYYLTIAFKKGEKKVHSKFVKII